MALAMFQPFGPKQNHAESSCILNLVDFGGRGNLGDIASVRESRDLPPEAPLAPCQRLVRLVLFPATPFFCYERGAPAQEEQWETDVVGNPCWGSMRGSPSAAWSVRVVRVRGDDGELRPNISGRACAKKLWEGGVAARRCQPPSRDGPASGGKGSKSRNKLERIRSKRRKGTG